MKQRGYTLIELLGVLVMMSILALIAIPIIFGMIEKAKKHAFLNSAYGIMKSAEFYYASSLISNDATYQTFTFPGDTTLSFSGQRPKNGYVQVNKEGRVELQLYNGKWCAYKSYYSTTIHLEEGACQNFRGSIVLRETETTYFKGEVIDILEGVSAYDHENHEVNDSIVYEGTVDRKTPGEYHITYYLKDDEHVQAEKTFYILNERYHKDYDYTGDVQTFEALYDGVYEIEVWGASGGKPTDTNYGNGAYTKGTIHLKKGDTFYIYVGEKGGNDRNSSFNGGGTGGLGSTFGFSGGGASDVRLISGSWDDLESLKSRVMVAGGGGGVAHDLYTTAGDGSYAGGLTGFSGGYDIDHGFKNQNGKGGTQISGGSNGENIFGSTGQAYSGGFGVGGNNDTTSSKMGAGGGGGGYYGGGAGGSTGQGGHGQGGGGGSSFISGYEGCNAIDPDGNPTNQSNHYSGVVFRNSFMASGREEMPNPRGEGTIQGNNENGYVRITLLHDIEDYAMIYMLGDERIVQRDEVLRDPGYEIVLGNAPSTITYHVEVDYPQDTDFWNLQTITYSLYDDQNQLMEMKKREVLRVQDVHFDYTGQYETFTVPYSGIYQFELWGASGGKPTGTNYGNGAYTKGMIHLKKGDKFYIYVGEKGGNDRNSSFNGGGTGGLGSTFGFSGGGASDVRLISGSWDDLESLKSRVMVAGGGGGVAHDLYTTAGDGSYAGGLTGFSGGYDIDHGFKNQNGKGGTQISGGSNGENIFGSTGQAYSGGFGVGGNNDTTSSKMGAGGGGGGYYGGGAGGSTGQGGHGQGGGGGSSFISGYEGCNAIDPDGNPTNQPNHYSGFIFEKALMLGGNEKMPNPRGDDVIIGNDQNGYVKIEFISF